MVPESVEREVLIDAPREVVWEVITQAEHIAGWFGDTADIDLRPGGRITVAWEGEPAEQGRVERVEPPEYFAYRWLRGEDAEPDESNSTLVEFTLREVRNGTRLRVVESGFSKLDLPEEDRKKDADEHAEGWKQELGELVEYVNQLERGSGRP